MRKLITLLNIALAFTATTDATLAQVLDSEDYVVYYSAVNSTFITPEIAESYGIKRASRSAFLNISVQRKQEDGISLPVTAVVSGVKTNLLQQSKPLSFREVRESEAIYYLSEFEFSNAENLRFTLKIIPSVSDQALNLEWETKLFAGKD
jgi:hypothetical protein